MITANNDNTHALFITVIAILLAVCVSLGIVWMRQQIHKSAHHIHTLEEQIDNVQRKKLHLNTQIATLESPENLKRQAVAKNLVAVNANQVVYVQGSKPVQSPRTERMLVACATRVRSIVE